MLPWSPHPCQPSGYQERVLWELWDGWRMSEGLGKAPAWGQMEPPRKLGGVPSCAIPAHAPGPANQPQIASRMFSSPPRPSRHLGFRQARHRFDVERLCVVGM